MDIIVGLKYCGHCQPHMSMVEFARDLQKSLPNIGFTRWDDFDDYSLLLVLCACPAQCVKVTGTQAPQVIVGCHSLNFVDYASRDELLDAAAKLLRQTAKEKS